MSSLGAFTFDAMRGRLSPDASPVNADGRLTQKGASVPVIGEIETDTLCADKVSAITASNAYRLQIGNIVTANINGDSIAQVLVADCLTSISGAKPSLSLKAKWKLVAYKDWQP